MEFDFVKLFSDEVFFYFLVACHSIAFVIWILTLVTDKHSFMDKLWPILPGAYAWGFLYTSQYLNPAVSGQFKTSITRQNDTSSYRLVLMPLLMSMWGVRLGSYFWRRGYYSWDFEDHRWDLVKKRMNYPQKKLAFHIFNFVFMALMQNWILIGYALPMWYIQTHGQDPFNELDALLAALYVLFFIIEGLADEQQWFFQSRKYKWIAEEKSGVRTTQFSSEEIEDFKRGFLCKGLFSFVRHPNYFADIFLWLCIYGFTLSAQYSSLTVWSLFNYSAYASLLMVYLFQRSVRVSELLSKSKYPEYAYYQSKVGRIWPSLTPYEPPKRD
jgi:steroid 5-alpha reductase family enzyme